MGRACSKYRLDDGDGGRALTSYGVGSETESAVGVGTRARYNKSGGLLGMHTALALRSSLR